MEEPPENVKESSHSAHANGINECHESHTYQGKIKGVSDNKPNCNHIPVEIQKPNFTVH